MIKINQEIINICRTLQHLTDIYDAEFSEIEKWFEAKNGELLKKQEDNAAMWRREAAAYKKEIKEQREAQKRIGDNRTNVAREYESRLVVQDRSYEKRRHRGKLTLGEDFEYPYNDNANPLEQLDYIDRRVNELVTAYTSNNPPHLVREFLSRKGMKRHKAYAELEFLMDRAEALKRMLDKSVQTVADLHRIIDCNAALRIAGIQEKYENDTNLLDLAYVNKVKEIRRNFEQQLKLHLSIEDLEAIDQKVCQMSLDTEKYCPSADMPDGLPVGSFGFEIVCHNDRKYVAGVLDLMFGTYMKDGMVLELPLILDADTSHQLFIHNRNRDERFMEQARGFICRYLLHMPVAGVHCCFIDGYYSGSNFKIYSEINNVDNSIVGNEVATSPQMINRMLDDILKSNETIVQKRLLHHDNLFQYNQEAGAVYEKYTLLVIDNFPKGFQEESLDKLERILLKGEQCAVSVLIHFDETLYVDEYGNTEKYISSIKNSMECFIQESGLLYPQNDKQYALRLYGVMGNWNKLLQKYCLAATSASTQSSPLKQLLLDDEELFARNSCDRLVIPFGINGPGKVQNLVFGEGVSHSGILAGKVGSGKSTLLHSLILSAVSHYGPEELSLYLMDFKQGMEFALYANNQVPQVKFVSIESQQELGASVLGKLCDEIERRSTLFKAARAKDIQGYRKKTGNALPRILLIIDEYQILFNVNNQYKIAETCAERMNIIVKQGRSYGIHVLMATQGIAHLSDLSIDSSLYGQMAVRIVLNCTREDSELLLDRHYKIVDTFGSQKGVGAYVSDESSLPEKFVTAFMKEEERSYFLNQIGSYYRSRGIEPDTVVYDGSRDVFFASMLSESDNLKNLGVQDGDYKIVLGESMGDVKPVTVCFEPDSKTSLLAVLKNQKHAKKLFASFIRCLLISKKRDTEYRSVSPFLFLCEHRFRKRREDDADQLEKLGCQYEDISYANGDTQIYECILSVYQELEQRKNLPDQFSQPLFLVLFGLQNMSNVLDTFDGEDADIDYFAEENVGGEQDVAKGGYGKSAGQMFRILLEKGPRHNIFLIVWMDSSQSVKKLEYEDLKLFGHMVIGRMSADDSESLVGMPGGNSLTENQLIYCDENESVLKLKRYL